MTSIASWLESNTNVIDMGSNSFFVPKLSVQHFYMTMLLSHLIHCWYWTCRYEQKAFGSHMVTTQQPMFSTYNWHKCTESKRLTSLQHASGIWNLEHMKLYANQRSNEPPSMHTHREGRKGHGCLMRTIRFLDISSWCEKKRSSKDFFQLHLFFQEATLMT